MTTDGLEALGFNAGWAFVYDEAASGHANPAWPARVVRVDRGRVVVHDGAEERSVPLTGAFIVEPPAVGDFVGVEDAGRLAFVLDRRQLLSRRRAGTDLGVQVLAANVDVVLLASPADRLNPAWVERALTLAWESGATPVVVVTKADLLEDPDETRAALESRAVGAEVLLISALEGAGLDEVRARLPSGITGVLLGPSGAGKSTLLNALLGGEVAATQAVRAGDAKGRHTTVRRELHRIPEGGLLIDTPGTRELGLLAGGEAEGSGFDDIDALGEDCRFRDCGHLEEPGCAVRDAVESGDIPRARYESFQRQQRERRYLDEKAMGTDHEKRAREKAFARVVKDVKRLKGR